MLFQPLMKVLRTSYATPTHDGSWFEFDTGRSFRSREPFDQGSLTLLLAQVKPKRRSELDQISRTKFGHGKRSVKFCEVLELDTVHRQEHLN
jgi:hypothetical protein